MWEGYVHADWAVWIGDRGCEAGVVAVGDACPRVAGKRSGVLERYVVPWEPTPKGSLDQ